MVGSNESVNWEDENGSDYEISVSDNQSDQSAQGYLDEQAILNNFSLSHQGGGDAGNTDISNKFCPLGLRLEKTPSLLNLVRRSVAKAKEDNAISKRVKAGNLPADSIMIGNWQRYNRHGGDITAKMYYAKQQFVWEVLLEGDVKYKMEIQWSDVTAIRGLLPENEPQTLEVELSKPPKYFRETSSKPRKHTLWKEAPDFTGGQASVRRRHIVSFKPGTLEKYYEKLMLCNERLFELSMKPFPNHESPYFYPAFHLPNTDDGENMNSNQSSQPQPQPQPAPWNQSPSHTNQTY